VGEVLRAMEHLPHRPLIFFGHSFGALLAFEVARELRRKGRPLPRHFIASASMAPSAVPARRQKWAGLDDDGAMFDRLVADGGVSPELLAYRAEFLAMMPSVRAEYGILSRYEFVQEPPLPVPLTRFRATHDTLVNEQGMSEWPELFADTARDVLFDGDHFFVDSQKPELARRLCAVAAPLLGGRVV